MYALPCVGQNRWSRTFLKPLHSSENYYTKHIITSKRSDMDDVCVYVYRVAEKENVNCPSGWRRDVSLTHTHTQTQTHTHTEGWHVCIWYHLSSEIYSSTAASIHSDRAAGMGRWQTSVHTRKRGKGSLYVLCVFANMWATKCVCHCKIVKDWIYLSLQT